MKLTRYAWPQMHLLLAAMLLLAGMLYWKAATWHGSLFVAAELPLVVAAWCLWFFRDPDRTPPEDPNLLVSPADGTVTDITLLGPDCVLGENATQVGVFMSVFSVHVNRAPAAGTIDRVEHQPGVYLDARDPAASERNEATTIHMTILHEGEPVRIVYRQIAGLVARRIVADVKPGDNVEKGRRVGMIKFGSRCELIVPRRVVGRIGVDVRDSAVAGETVLLELKHEDLLK